MPSDFYQEITKTVKILSKSSFEEKITHSTGPFKNKGSIKPFVDKVNSYTVSWKIFSSNSDLEDFEVKTKLPLYIDFNENIYPKDIDITYNEKTREIIWKLKKVKAFSGYKFAPPEAYFGINFRPHTNQVGTSPVLVNKKKYQI